MRPSRQFWIGACAAGGVVAALPAAIFVAAVRELGRLSGSGSHAAWLGSMFQLALAALAAAATVVFYVATVGGALLGRRLLRRRRNDSREGRRSRPGDSHGDAPDR